jgi:hypothetical protein
METRSNYQNIEIMQSPYRMLVRVIRSALFIILIIFLCISVTLLSSGSLVYFVFPGIFFIIGLMFHILMLAWRLLTVSGPVITLSVQGIRDTRISTEFIPWNAITWTLETHMLMQPAKKPTILTMVIDETIDKQLKKTQKGGLEEIFSRFKGLKGYEFTSHASKLN